MSDLTSCIKYYNLWLPNSYCLWLEQLWRSQRQGGGGTLKNTSTHIFFFSQSAYPPPLPVPSKFSNSACFDGKNISFWDVSQDFRETYTKFIDTDALWAYSLDNSRFSALYHHQFEPCTSDETTEKV